MKMFAWNLITLDAAKILCNLTERNLIRRDGNYRVNFMHDLSGKNIFDCNVILSEESFADNALFFQLRKVLPKNAAHEDAENLLRTTIIFVDFKKVFAHDLFAENLTGMTPSKNDLLSDKGLIFRLKQLFEDGLLLSFDGKEYKHFVPFDKSSSMARHCQMTFLDSQVKAALDKRLMLDMDFVGTRLELSKFYAYRGLYLSAAFRPEINPTEFLLNEETVIVLPDYKTALLQKVFTAARRDERIFWEYETCEKKLTLKLFDGEGLISPDVAKYLSDSLRTIYNLSSDSHSFQIRLPFTKGVLHEVDFNKFFSEQLENNFDELLIKDIFGVTRDLRKAKIILTQSMFKCANWIKNAHCFEPDPMKYFFEKFAEYDHALYVTNTEARLANPGRVKLNYQFISTLAFSEDDFDSLVADQKKRIESFNENFIATLAAPTDEQNVEDETIDEPADNLKMLSAFSRTSCLKIASKNPAFLRDPKVKSIYDNSLKNYACDFGLGRPEVEGEQRFLSCDLAVLLIKILENVENISLDVERLKFLKKQCLYPNRFFMAENKIKLNPDKQCAFLRNPHLSRNEQVLLRAYVNRKSLHEEYFSHLKGVVMISALSTAAMALGGADYDGDLVKVVADSRIVEAVKRGNPNLPPIEIPCAKPTELILGRSIPVSVVIDTFANKIGEVSNLAVKFAGKEYFSSPVAQNYKDACAKCTIVVGLETDAAKTGIHPAENIKDLKALAKSGNENLFLTAKKIINKILSGNYSPVVVREEKTLTLYLSAEAQKRGLSAQVLPLEEKGLPFLERLPARYLQLIFEQKSSALTAMLAAPSNFFTFEVSGWRKTVDDTKRERLFKLVKAYLRILSLDRKMRYMINVAKEKTFHGHVINLLKIQYDDIYQTFLCGVALPDALNQLYAELSFRLENIDAVKNALNSLKVEKWHLTAEKIRPHVAAKILGSETGNLPGVFDLLYNFRCNGFMIFYYVLRELQLRLFEGDDALEKLTSENDNFEFDNNPYYEELYETYSKSVALKKSKPIWNAQLKKICRRYLHEIFGDDLREALKYYWSKRSEDSGHNFLWNVFTESEISSQLYTPQTSSRSEVQSGLDEKIFC